MKYKAIPIKGTNEAYLVSIPETATDQSMLPCDALILQLLDEIEQLNKHSVSGKRPDYKHIRAAAVIHAEQYKVNNENFDMMKYSINDFMAGAQWVLSQAACASGAVDTVAEAVEYCNCKSPQYNRSTCKGCGLPYRRF